MSITLEELAKTVEDLKHEVVRLQAVNEIQLLMGKYEVHHNRKDWGRGLELFALELPDVCMEVSDWGVFLGREGLEYFFSSVGPPSIKGVWMFHALATPMIQVAKDGMTAKCHWWSPGYTSTPTPRSDEVQAFWTYGQYAVDFIKIDGVWKIWHLKWFRHFRADYNRSWLEESPENVEGGGPQMPDVPYIMPYSYFYPLNRENPQRSIPAYPDEYDTYDPSLGFSWIYGDMKDSICADLNEKRSDWMSKWAKETDK